MASMQGEIYLSHAVSHLLFLLKDLRVSGKNSVVVSWDAVLMVSLFLGAAWRATLSPSWREQRKTKATEDGGLRM